MCMDDAQNPTPPSDPASFKKRLLDISAQTSLLLRQTLVTDTYFPHHLHYKVHIAKLELLLSCIYILFV